MTRPNRNTIAKALALYPEYAHDADLAISAYRTTQRLRQNAQRLQKAPAWRRLSLEEKRLELLIDPPPWAYDPATGILTSLKRTAAKPITSTRYKGVLYHPAAIRIWLRTGHYPELTAPARPLEPRPLPTGLPDGGPADYRLANIQVLLP